MTSWSVAVLGKESQLFPLTFGEVMVRLLKQRYPHSSLAKMAESAFGLDPKTARNFTTKQAFSSTSLLRSVKTVQQRTGDHWDLWDAIGETLFGESRSSYDERRLHAAIEALNAQQKVARLRERREHMEAEASRLVDLGAGLAPAHGWRDERRSWGETDGHRGGKGGEGLTRPLSREGGR